MTSKIFAVEEIVFLAGLIIWSFIRAHEPSILSLEKFMDFGFVNSILRTTYQPATDMWFPPDPINYYYFGHLVTAVMTKLSTLQSNISYNLMIATLFSFCFSLSSSIGLNLFNEKNLKKIGVIAAGLTGTLVALSGNLHTIYAFFTPYDVNNPVPFWTLKFLPNNFPNSYWYPNATRFIPFTIHEFPIYSFVVSDLHGHVLDIPFVLLIIALLFSIYKGNKFFSFDTKTSAFIGFLLALMYMTNVWDGLIYFLLAALVILIKKWNEKNIQETFFETLKPTVVILFSFFVFSLPFNIFFKPFASGIGILCAPTFLTNMGKVGPFLFEANHCQKSPWWQLLTLYGFFYFFIISFFVFLRRVKKIKVHSSDIFVVTLIFLSTLLILVPEIIYVKDIYPEHYRANTMFKLVYQAFIMLSISSAYIIFKIWSNIKGAAKKIFAIITFVLLSLILIYPYFAVMSYYADLKNYSGLDGTVYMKTNNPQDYDAIQWINKNIKGNPVFVEAQGDSYTDYERISANTGLPTILGWTVHEWLWRGSYNIPAPRITEVKDIYESPNIELTKQLLQKYNAKYIIIGALERQKYPDIVEPKFNSLGKIVWQEGSTKIYKLNI